MLAVVPIESVPEAIRDRVISSAPIQMKMMVARALLPMGPNEVFTSLVYLASNETGELAATARRSLADLPSSVVLGVVHQSRDEAILGFTMREYIRKDEVVERILLNSHTPDSTVEWAARRVSARLVTLIANNQERLTRHAPLVEAIYYNPEAPMITVQRAFETGVRSGLNLYHIPGFREIYISIFDKEPVGSGAPVEETAKDKRPEQDEAAETLDEQALPLEDLEIYKEQGLGDDDYTKILREAAREEDESTLLNADGDDEEEKRQSVYQKIRSMSVAQRVRLALVGNARMRGLLIRDSKTLVSLSVLKSPRLTDKEIAQFAKAKSTPDQVVQAICRSREWTRTYPVQRALLQNPKTQPMYSNRYIRNMTPRDLRDLSRNRDIPGYIARMAKNIINQREKGKK
jgi:hypothetical protein